MIANSNWSEIQEALLPGQTASNQPNIVARVFEQKHDALMHDIKNRCWFNKVVGHVYVIEFQKWTLPHMHFLFFLHMRIK
jgi:hypothetical protein